MYKVAHQRQAPPSMNSNQPRPSAINSGHVSSSQYKGLNTT